MTAVLTQATFGRPAETTAVRAAAVGAGTVLLGFAGLQVARAAATTPVAEGAR